MKEVLAVIIVSALLIGGNALAMHQFGDRETFVPAPEVVAEEFVREIAGKRWDRARSLLLDPESMPDAELAELRMRIGEPVNIEGETITRTDSEALANVRVEWAEGSNAIALQLQFDDEWKIAHTPAVGNPIH